MQLIYKTAVSLHINQVLNNFFFKICSILTNTVSYKGSLINYFRFANGDKILFCFHGYGENAETFLFLEKYLEKKYTLIAIDFPLHGKTVWGNDEIFLPDDLINIIELINPEPEKKFSVLAYSMGGRIALHLLQTIPESIENIGLVAPDGLHLNFWYWLGTQTKTGNRLFKITTKNPAWIFWLMNMIDKTGLLNKSLVNFSRKFLEDKQERIMLYKRWTMMKKFKPTHAGDRKSVV